MIDLHDHGKRIRLLAATVPLLVATASAQAAHCIGSKVIQSCTTATTPGTPNYGGCLAANNADIASPGYTSCIASAPPTFGPTTCTPLRVPCDYPEDVFDLLFGTRNSEN